MSDNDRKRREALADLTTDGRTLMVMLRDENAAMRARLEWFETAQEAWEERQAKLSAALDVLKAEYAKLFHENQEMADKLRKAVRS